MLMIFLAVLTGSSITGIVLFLDYKFPGDSTLLD